MGSPDGEGYPGDGEGPIHPVTLDAFGIDATPVTNDPIRCIRRKATGYRHRGRTIRHLGGFDLASRPAIPQTSLGRPPGAPWWLGSSMRRLVNIPRAPINLEGPCDTRSSTSPGTMPGLLPVGWEAAPYRGRMGIRRPRGVATAALPLGRRPTCRGAPACNIWQGLSQPNTLDDGFLGTARSDLPPERLRPHNRPGMSGNGAPTGSSPSSTAIAHDHPQGPTTGKRVMRGGSYLCHDSYCNRYRVAARTANTPDSSSCTCGFRTVADQRKRT